MWTGSFFQPAKGPVRLHAALLEVADRPPPEVLDHVMAAVWAWCAEPEDDIILVVARRLAGKQQATPTLMRPPFAV